jgi:tetratricopeptide (TPR) repeat protein
MSVNRIVASACLGTAVAVSSLTALAGPNSAPPPDFSVDGDPNKARREWMNKGNAEYVQKHWEEAREYYLKSWDIKHHYTIAANLADVEMKLGHYAEAVGYLKYVLGNIPDTKPDDRKAAEEQLLECKSYLTAVRVATDVTDATVYVDGRDVGQTPLGEELLLEPGKHVLSVTKPGYGNRIEKLSAEGNQIDVTITLEKVATQASPSPSLPAATPQAHPESPMPDNGSYRLASYIGFGVGVLGVGAGTYFAIKAHKTQSDSFGQFTSCSPHCSAAENGNIADLDEAAKNQRTASVASFIVGGVGLAAGVTFLVLDSNKRSAQAAVAIVRPWVGPGQMGILGSF